MNGHMHNGLKTESESPRLEKVRDIPNTCKACARFDDIPSIVLQNAAQFLHFLFDQTSFGEDIQPICWFPYLLIGWII